MKKTPREMDKDAELSFVYETLKDLEKQTKFHFEKLAKGDTEAEAALIRLNEQIKIMRACYQTLGNPVFAWRALLICRDAGFNLPDWIVEYLYHSGLNIVNAAYKGDKPPGEILPDALSFGRHGKGQGGWFQQYKKALTNMGALAEVMAERTTKDISYETARHEAARRLIDQAVKDFNAEIREAQEPALKIESGQYVWKRGIIKNSFIEALMDKHFNFMLQSDIYNKSKASIIEEIQNQKRLDVEMLGDLKEALANNLNTWWQSLNKIHDAVT